MRPSYLALCTILVSLCLASPTWAATLVATPAGGNAIGCPASDPCSLPNAVAQSAAADDIVAGSGTYTLAAPLTLDKGQHLRGAAGPSPTLTISGDRVLRLLQGSQARHLRVVQTGATGLNAVTVSQSSIAEDISVTASTTGSNGAVLLAGGTPQDPSILRDAVVEAPAVANAAIWVQSISFTPTFAVLRNVTAVATASGSAGILVTGKCEPISAASGSNSTANVRNSIFRGASVDLRLTSTGADAATCSNGFPQEGPRADVDYSNYRTTDISPPSLPGSYLTEGTHNQKASGQTNLTSIFADADRHEKSTSPTRNAGVADSRLGTVDLDGDARNSESAPDIGADEYPEPPAFSTSQATAVGPDKASLNGTVTATSPTTVHFEFGTTTAYGSSSAVQTVAPGVAVPVSIPIDGLAPGTTYHVRLAGNVTSASELSGSGADVVFSTSAGSSPDTPSCDQARKKLSKAKEKLEKAKKSGNQQKVKHAKAKVKKAKQRVRKVC